MNTTSPVETRKTVPIFPDESANKSPRSILVADANAQSRESLASALKGFGYKVTGQVSSGDEAVAFSSEHHPDLVMLVTPDGDGETLDAVSKIWSQTHCAVFVIADSLEPAHVLAFNSAGAVAVLGKEAPDTCLRATIESAYSCAFAIRSMQTRIEQLERNLVHRRLVEEAKWKMVSESGMTEPEAHTKLQHHARSERIQLATVAEMVIKGELKLD
ncbi:MAG: ANTAR domain-containing protein [Phycisphaeraceae bacterium]|nr:ANTAR domain-containing protein [Phycisphaeraceae bacterium]MCB9847434.1 ANTAR domain-containing protein [Phycisphaeraceae bacterium]